MKYFQEGGLFEHTGSFVSQFGLIQVFSHLGIKFIQVMGFLVKNEERQHFESTHQL